MLFHSVFGTSRYTVYQYAVTTQTVFMMPVYGPLMAFLSSLMVKLSLCDTQAAITWMGKRLQCNYAAATYQIPFTLGFFNIAVFAGLVLPLQNKGDWKTFASSMLGLTGAVMLNAILIANSVTILVRYGHAAFNGFLLIEEGLLLAVPFAFWWVVSNGAGAGDEKQRV